MIKNAEIYEINNQLKMKGIDKLSHDEISFISEVNFKNTFIKKSQTAIVTSTVIIFSIGWILNIVLPNIFNITVDFNFNPVLTCIGVVGGQFILTRMFINKCNTRINDLVSKIS